jgi:hypothetical protein
MKNEKMNNKKVGERMRSSRGAFDWSAPVKRTLVLF